MVHIHVYKLVFSHELWTSGLALSHVYSSTQQDIVNVRCVFICGEISFGIVEGWRLDRVCRRPDITQKVCCKNCSVLFTAHEGSSSHIIEMSTCPHSLTVILIYLLNSHMCSIRHYTDFVLGTWQVKLSIRSGPPVFTFSHTVQRMSENSLE